ncbi:GNAT family N-acetyltransferase [Kribbella sp. NPDC023855]|uniref:GNAT family N-acetyltransferase n=1 Tax=Kribbella sp. NPDC023855 TaxID=3154698 RepID=UPI0034074738
MDDAWTIEEYAAKAWPAAHAEKSGGWLLRSTPGVGRRRSNSALPLKSGGQSIATAEAFFAEHQLPVCIQIAPAELNTELDAELAAKGYQHAAPTLVLTASTEEVLSRTPHDQAVVVEVSDKPTTPWLQGFVELDDHGDSAIVAESVLSQLAEPAAYVSVTLDGRIACSALFVGAPGMAGLFCMATRAEYRRQGLATAVLYAGAEWASSRGAERLYLQVEAGNEPARRLYESVGFARSHTYHYRVA